jgi:hypothetical protein
MRGEDQEIETTSSWALARRMGNCMSIDERPRNCQLPGPVAAVPGFLHVVDPVDAVDAEGPGRKPPTRQPAASADPAADAFEPSG